MGHETAPPPALLWTGSQGGAGLCLHTSFMVASAGGPHTCRALLPRVHSLCRWQHPSPRWLWRQRQPTRQGQRQSLFVVSDLEGGVRRRSPHQQSPSSPSVPLLHHHQKHLGPRLGQLWHPRQRRRRGRSPRLSQRLQPPARSRTPALNPSSRVPWTLLPSHLRRWPRAATFSNAVACKRTESALSADLHIETKLLTMSPVLLRRRQSPRLRLRPSSRHPCCGEMSQRCAAAPADAALRRPCCLYRESRSLHQAHMCA